MASGTLYRVNSLVDKDWDEYYLEEYLVVNYLFSKLGSLLSIKIFTLGLGTDIPLPSIGDLRVLSKLS